MANSRGLSTTRNTTHNGRHPLLPPKSPFPTISPSYSDYIDTGIRKYRDGNSHHQRASSESLLIEEQPSWLDDLLNEPETPLQRSHRRSSSDSFTYLEAVKTTKMEYFAKNEHPMRNASQDFFFKDIQNTSFYVRSNFMVKNKPRGWDLSQNDGVVLGRSVSLDATQDFNEIALTTNEKTEDFETDSKRAKQQFAQRSRVRKLQYIADLERNVQALQAGGCEVSAELAFLNRQSLILGMENKALKQRLENLAQEQIIKCLEHEVLEREIGRLRALYQQQQPPPQSHRRTASHDRLDFQFANFSLKNKDSTSTHDTVSSQPRT